MHILYSSNGLLCPITLTKLLDSSEMVMSLLRRDNKNLAQYLISFQIKTPLISS